MLTVTRTLTADIWGIGGGPFDYNSVMSRASTTVLGAVLSGEVKRDGGRRGDEERAAATAATRKVGDVFTAKGEVMGCIGHGGALPLQGMRTTPGRGGTDGASNGYAHGEGGWLHWRCRFDNGDRTGLRRRGRHGGYDSALVNAHPGALVVRAAYHRCQRPPDGRASHRGHSSTRTATPAYVEKYRSDFPPPNEGGLWKDRSSQQYAAAANKSGGTAAAPHHLGGLTVLICPGLSAAAGRGDWGRGLQGPLPCFHGGHPSGAARQLPWEGAFGCDEGRKMKMAVYMAMDGEEKVNLVEIEEGQVVGWERATGMKRW